MTERNGSLFREKWFGEILENIYRAFEENPEITVSDSPWFNEKIPMPYEAAIFRDKSHKFLIVYSISEDKTGKEAINLFASDYFEPQEEGPDTIRSVFFKDNIPTNSSKFILNGNIVKDGFFDRRAKTALTEEEKIAFLNEINKASLDKELTRKLEKIPPVLRFNKGSWN